MFENSLSSETLLRLCEENQCPPGASVSNECWHGFSENTLDNMLKALETGACPGVILHLEGTSLDDDGMQRIAKTLASGQCPEKVSFYISQNSLSDQSLLYLANAIESGRCPRGLFLKFDSNDFSDDGVAHLVRALNSGNCSKDLTLSILDENITDNSANALAEILPLGRCPSGLTIELGMSLTDDATDNLSRALQKEGCPQGFKLVLTYNKQLTNRSLDYIGQALEAGLLPERLQLGIQYSNKITASANEAIFTALEKQLPPLGFRMLNLKTSQYQDEKLQRLQQAPLINAVACYQFWSAATQKDNCISTLPNELMSSIITRVMQFKSPTQLTAFIAKMIRLKERYGQTAQLASAAPMHRA